MATTPEMKNNAVASFGGGAKPYDSPKSAEDLNTPVSQSVFFPNPGVVREYPLNASDDEIGYDYNVNVLGKTPDEYYSHIEPATAIGKAFKAMRPYFQHGQEAMKLFATRPDVALGLSKDITPYELSKIYKPWGDLIIERGAQNQKEANEKHVWIDKALQDGNIAPWLLFESIPGEALEQGTRPSSWIGMYAAEKVIGAAVKYGPALINKAIAAAPENVRSVLLKDIFKSESSLAKDFEALGISPNSKTADVKKAYLDKTLENHPDRGGSAESFIAVKKSYDNIMSARQSIVNKWLDAFRGQNSEIRPNLRLAGERGSADLIPSEGDIIKIGEDVGKLVSMQGEKAIVNIKGKDQEVNLSEITNNNALLGAKENDSPLNFKTAEEYVASKGEIFYHGGGRKITEFSGISDSRGGLGAAYFTDSKEVAEKYAYGGGIDNTKSIEEYKKMQVEKLPNRKPTVTEAILDIKNPLVERDVRWKDVLETLGEDDISEALYKWDNNLYFKLQDEATNDGFNNEVEWIKKNWEYLEKELTDDAFSGTDTESLAKSPIINFLNSSNLLKKFMSKRKYDGIIIEDAEAGGKTYIPLTKEQIKTKSQLTAEFNEAKKKKSRFDNRGENDLVPNASPEDESMSAVSAGAKSAVNPENLQIAEDARQQLDRATEAVGKEIENQTGRPLTHEEVIEKSKQAEILTKGASREATLNFEAALLKTREHLAALAEQPELTPEFLDTLRIVANTGTDIARQLESFKIAAMPEYATVKTQIIKELIKLGRSSEEILSASQGVDFKDQTQVAEFYRKFVKPTLSQELDEFAYINILSSPRTHIVNAFSNLIQMAGLNPLTRLASGAVDMVASGLRGAARDHYVSEVPQFYKGAINAIPDAIKAVNEVMAGKQYVERPDVKHIPTNSKRVQIATLGAGKFVTRALEASDVFFRTMIESGEVEALLERNMKMGTQLDEKLMADVKKEAKRRAEYYVFRSPVDPPNKSGQGSVLSSIDTLTNAVYGLRDVAGVKWFIRFVRTPMNILKQGIEYSPAGITTLNGAKDKDEQIGKTILGSLVFGSGLYLATSGKTTWSVPRRKKEREMFYQSGRVPYSININGTWVSYSKLGPLAYPLAMASAIHYYENEAPGAMSEGVFEKAADALSATMQFFGDQSYVQDIGSLVKLVQGEKSAMSNLITSVPNQLIPLSSLQRWANGFLDPIYRKAEKGISPEAILDNLQKSIILMSQYVPAAKDAFGRDSVKKFPLVNAVSPMQISPADNSGEALLKATQQAQQISSRAKKMKEDALNGVKSRR